MEQQKLSFRIRLCNFSGSAILLMMVIIFGFLTVVSLVQTCHVDINFTQGNSEHVSFLTDNVLLNIAILAVLLALSCLLLRAKPAKRTVNTAFVCMLAVSTAIGIWWILASKALPVADSEQIVDRVRHLMAGEDYVLREASYFYLFPFQFGYMLYAEGIMRLFPNADYLALALSNVICVNLAYTAVFLIAKKLFDDARIFFLTTLYLGLCLQPVFLTTFLYGPLPGLAFGLWGTYFVIRCIQGEKLWSLLPAAILLIAAVVIKKNYLILLIANVIVLLIHSLRNKRALPALCALVILALSLAAPIGVQRSYERRLNAEFGKGTPQLAWLVTGFKESSLCCGWYNGYTTTVLMNNGYDYDKTVAQAREDLIQQLTMFASRPRYLASFMYHKITSQWNEPAFQCIWSSAVGTRSGEVSPIIESLGTGTASDVINAYFNQLMQYVYVGFTLGLIFLLKRKGRADEALILPLVILGAAIYHALFEAKSQYALIYVPMMLPYAAYGITVLTDKAAERIRARAISKECKQGS